LHKGCWELKQMREIHGCTCSGHEG
jgi:hypothetical protein